MMCAKPHPGWGGYPPPDLRGLRGFIRIDPADEGVPSAAKLRALRLGDAVARNESEPESTPSVWVARYCAGDVGGER
jgi:hypothetical protein